MKRTILAAALVALAAPALAGPAPATPSAAVTVHIKDFTFAPAPLRIHAGERVHFVNDDDEAHTVTAADKSFDSEGIDGGASWDHVFDRPGTFAYFCELHPYMKATIVVTK